MTAQLKCERAQFNRLFVREKDIFTYPSISPHLQTKKGGSMFHLMKWFLGLTLVLAWALSSQAADPVHPGLKPQLNKIPEAMSTEPTPTPQVPGVKTAPGLTAPVPTKQGITAPLGQKASIAVKSPAQGAQHPADKPLAIIWDRSAIATAATVNILLVDKPGGTAKATIKAGAPNTGSFTFWIAPQQYTAAGNSWAIRIETADSKASGHSGTFSFVRQPVSGMGVTPSVKSGVTVQEPTIAGGATSLAVTKNATGMSPLATQTPGILAQTPQTSAISQDQGSGTPLLNELKLGKRKDFSRVSLAGLDLSNLNLEQVIFQGADLSGADMTGADLRGVDFTGANLTGANLTEAKCEKVSFRYARLNKAILKQTLLSAADFTGATLDGAIFESVIIVQNSIPIKISNAQGAVFNNSYFYKHDFKSINMKNLTINGGSFTYTDFTGANLDGLIISNNPMFRYAKIPVKYINQFQGKTDSFPYIQWVN